MDLLSPYEMLLHYNIDTDEIWIGKADGSIEILKFNPKYGIQIIGKLSFHSEDFTAMAFISLSQLAGGYRTGMIQMLFIEQDNPKIFDSKIFHYHKSKVI